MACTDSKPDESCSEGVRYWAVVQTWRDGAPTKPESRWEADRLYRHAKMVYDGHAATCSRTR